MTPCNIKIKFIKKSKLFTKIPKKLDNCYGDKKIIHLQIHKLKYYILFLI